VNARANYNRLSHLYDLFACCERYFTVTGLRMLAAHPGERVLEIGCGTGHGLVSLAQAVGRTGQVFGIDIAEGMLRLANARIQKSGLADVVSLWLGDARSLPFEAARPDAVFISFTLELFAYAEIPLVLGECRRALRSGGRIGLVSLAKKECHAVRVYEWFHVRFPMLVDCYPIHLRQSIAAAGFEVEEACEKTMWGLPVEMVVAVSPESINRRATMNAKVLEASRRKTTPFAPFSSSR